MSDRPSKQTPPRKAFLAPNVLTILALTTAVDLGTYWLYRRSHSQHAVLPGLLLILPYVALLVLRTGDAVRAPNAHPSDVFLCRYSGPLMMVTLLLLPVVCIAMALMGSILAVTEVQFRRIWPVFHSIIAFLLEFGTILGVAALKTPRSELARPQRFWKLISMPLLLVHVSLLILWLALAVVLAVENRRGL